MFLDNVIMDIQTKLIVLLLIKLIYPVYEYISMKSLTILVCSLGERFYNGTL